MVPRYTGNLLLLQQYKFQDSDCIICSLFHKNKERTKCLQKPVFGSTLGSDNLPIVAGICLNTAKSILLLLDSLDHPNYMSHVQPL